MDLMLVAIEVPETILMKEVMHEEITDELNRKRLD
jgi:hypothetical protein